MAMYPYLYLFVYCFILFSSITSMAFLWGILKFIKHSEEKENFRFSMMLKYYFWVMFAMDILLSIHSFTVMVIWKNDLDLAFIPFFWTATFDNAFMTVLPFTAFMLTLEKCLVLLLEEKYNQHWTVILFRISILINIVVAGVNLVMYILFHQPEKPKDCIAYACVLLNNAQLTYAYSRTIGIVLSTTVGIIFIVIISWFKRKKPQIGTKVKLIAEAILFRLVIFGIFCDFIPHVSAVIVVYSTGDAPFRFLGPYSRVIMAADLLLSSAINWMVCNRRRNQTVRIKVNTINIL